MEFDGFHQAYSHVLRSLIDEPEYRNSPRGFDSREQLGLSYRLREASQRIPLVPARRLNLVFNFAEALWYLSGRDDLDFIAYYAPSIRKYSADGVRLTGTAYGRALFGGGGGPVQWPTLVRQLREDPDSKRCVLQIFAADELAIAGNPDVSCTLGLQFMLREGALHGVGFMRANDAYRGMTSDVFSFTLIQEMLARELGAKLGSYTHLVGSVHLYDPDYQRAREVLADPAVQHTGLPRFPEMPEGDNWPWVKQVLEYEEALRQNRIRLEPDTSGLGVPEYWAQVLLMFEVYRRVRRSEPVDGELMAALSPLYRALVQQKWPQTASSATPVGS
ncbi:thymidylate synthase [Crossiella sp. CA198]|uniref:thymidylate synthase n=1 Tax=Crossiella sp. CA198 TaxID=3455607 RepID=UPI003F8D6AD6